MDTAEKLLEKWLAEMGIEPDRRGDSYVFATGSTAVILTPDGGDESGDFINIECPVLLKPRIGVSLMRELLARNARLRVGSFSLEGENVMLSYSMPAVEGAGVQFASILRILAKIADDADDELQKVFGGRRISDNARK